MSITKPLVDHLQENFNEEFSEKIQNGIPDDENARREDIVFLIKEAYREGFADGESVGRWANER